MDAQQQQYRDGPNEEAMRSAEEELRRRRERGRLSQARFRKRQAQASRETQAENERMRAAIADLVTAAAAAGGGGGGGNRAALLSAVRAAADAAGVDASALSEDGSATTTAVTAGGGRGIVQRGAGGGITDAKAGDRYTDNLVATTVPRVEGNYRPRSAIDCPRGGSWRLSTSQSSGRLSPRLDYGIWVDARRATRISTPPHEIVPFLGAGRWTFGGQLYWACADYMISLCRIVTSPHRPAPWFEEQSQSPDAREAEDRVGDMLQHAAPLRNVRLAQALAEDQRAYRDTGYIPGDSPVVPCGEDGVEDIGTLLRREIEADYASRGHDLSAWMTIPELEGHMRRQLGNAAFERLERAAVAAAPGRGGLQPAVCDEEVRNITRLLIRNLAESYTCFGDGPRWRADRISMLFTEREKVAV